MIPHDSERRKDLDRRMPVYTFTTKRDLTDFFATALDHKTIRKIIDTTTKNFQKREGVTPHDSAMQLLKKCEAALVKETRNKSTKEDESV
jgi:hypothetical protein